MYTCIKNVLIHNVTIKEKLHRGYNINSGYGSSEEKFDTGLKNCYRGQDLTR